MHRNTYINAPAHLLPTLQLRERPTLFFAGQIGGLEGYAGNIAGGWLAGVNAARLAHGEALRVPPPTTMMGALMSYLTHADPATFQPMKANFGIMPPLETPVRGKRPRAQVYAQRAVEKFKAWIRET
jgi:methylenetetrahydrofolate--tRNA-(uracil-5-)-methyltransferase